uniref:Uncharacterized protein n=1 Tax=Denticeps clupeoides TaxID=299321 RepID=A0AAY4ANN2_9TELE
YGIILSPTALVGITRTRTPLLRSGACVVNSIRWLRPVEAFVRPEPQNDSNTDEGPEYIPRKKAKNPMTKVGYAWMIGLPSGILAFILAKREVEKNRQKQLRIRQRMKKSNEGEYDSEPCNHHPITHFESPII